ncbi:MAG: 3'(2'),5'-bisphosphate nucleotidase CysQ [Nitrospirota bacterium]|nr:MAG: 3'(2'),5'-bisphosphate nucleotidase CysQ [Nitrospirota bacterium]
MQDFSFQLQIAVELARQAGRLILDIYDTDFSVSYKGKSDPVTEADQRANDLIVEGLQRQFPQDLIVAEESSPPKESMNLEFVWYVDPLDGTKEFIAKNGEFSVMIGLALNGQACLGVVYRPDKDILYSGISEQQSWIEIADEQKPLRTNSHTNPRDLSLTVSRSHRNPSMEEIKTAIGLHHEITSGSVGLKIGLIASGQADVYLEPGPYTSAWDACAPEAILRGAGGRFSDIFGRPIRYHPTTLKNTHGLVGTNGSCHDEVIEAISPIVNRLES